NLILPEDFTDECFEVVAKSSFVEEVGGDLYNYLKDEKGNYWFAIGDSSGHDFNSHLFSMMILTQMNYCVNVYENPDEIIDRINLNLESRSGNKARNSKLTYASFVIFKSDRDGNFIHSGSHPNFVIYRAAEEKIEIIETKGIFIGTDINFRKAEENNGTFHMNPGDILFSFTDGVFEVKDTEGRFYGEKIYKFLESTSKENLNILADRLFQSVREFSGDRITDDMTFLVIRKK
ncbi:MAG: serine/threonine-protein phosphatase, partial [Leptospira sp.]|nr:serine/threonine-protein phosphatase [Leptospira sp.]